MVGGASEIAFGVREGDVLAGKPRLSKIVVNVANADRIAGLQVKRVGTTVGRGQWGTAAAHCDGADCRDQQGVDSKAEAKSAGNVSTAAFVLGAADLAAGATLWLTAGSKSGSGSGAQVGLGPGSIVVRGTW